MSFSLNSMAMEIRPEPSEEERAAIVVGLEKLLAEEGSRDERAPEWWVASVRESVEGEADDPGSLGDRSPA